MNMRCSYNLTFDDKKCFCTIDGKPAISGNAFVSFVGQGTIQGPKV